MFNSKVGVIVIVLLQGQIFKPYRSTPFCRVTIKASVHSHIPVTFLLTWYIICRLVLVINNYSIATLVFWISKINHSNFLMRFNAWMNYYCCSVMSDLFFILNARVVILLITEIFAWIRHLKKVLFFSLSYTQWYFDGHYCHRHGTVKSRVN